LALLSGSNVFVVTAISQRVCHAPSNPCRTVIAVFCHANFDGRQAGDVANAKRQIESAGIRSTGRTSIAMP
jgi:hypothetical protein